MASLSAALVLTALLAPQEQVFQPRAAAPVAVQEGQVVRLQSPLLAPQDPRRTVVFSDGDGDGIPDARMQVLFEGGQERPWIGVHIATAPSNRVGLEVTETVDGSPATRAGLRPGDRLVALDREPLEDFDGLRARLQGHRAGDRVELELRREVAVRLDKRGYGDEGGPRLGVSLAQQAGDGGFELVVSSTEPGWPGAAAGLRGGDRLLSAGGREVDSFERVQVLLAEVEPGESFELVIARSIEIELGAFPEGETAPEPSGGFFLAQPPKAGQSDGFFEPGDGGGQRNVEPPPQVREFRWYADPDARPEAEPGQRAQTDGPRWARPAVPGPTGPGPRAGAQAAEGNRRLQEEMRQLSEELRGLREELRALREELGALRRERGR